MAIKKLLINKKNISCLLQHEAFKKTVTLSQQGKIIASTTVDVCAMKKINNGYVIEYVVAGQRISVCIIRSGGPAWHVFLPGKSDPIVVQADDRVCPVSFFENKFLQKPIISPLPLNEIPEEGVFVKSPLAGRVLRATIQKGEICKKGQPLCVIESMKMENEICAPCDALVKNILISPGDVVQQNQNVVVLESKGDENGATKGEIKQETI